MRHSDDGRGSVAVTGATSDITTMCARSSSRYGVPAGVIANPSATRQETLPDLFGTRGAR